MCLSRYTGRMEFANLLGIVGDEPVFDSALLFASESNLPYLQRQLSRWVQLGYLYQLRRELYMLAPPYQKNPPHPFLVANRMVRGSYVSTEAALAFYGLIPEYVPATTSVTTQRPSHWSNVCGEFQYQHIKHDLFFGYDHLQLVGRQYGFIATPEKALLDLIYLRSGGDAPEFLIGLRLQHLDRLRLDCLDQYAKRSGSHKLARAAKHIRELIAATADEYEVLQ